MLRALVTAARVVARFLRKIGEDPDPPPIAPARAPPFFRLPALRSAAGQLDQGILPEGQRATVHPMPDLLPRLLSAAEWGALLALAASCGGQTESSKNVAGGSGGASGGGVTSGGSGGVTSGGSGGVTSGGSGGVTSGGSGGAVDSGIVDSGGADSGLPTTPYPNPIGCYGPEYDAGYYGQCCEKAQCMDPVGGKCPTPTELWGLMPGYPSGSGTCTCGESKGPFGPHYSTEAPCCYLFGSIGCDGRPLLVHGHPRVAPLIARADWATFAAAA